MGRKCYKKTKVYQRNITQVAANYSKLYSLCCKGKHGNYASRNFEDIFSDTIIMVISDKEALKCKTVEAFIQHFCWRYKMIEFRIIQDSKQLKEIHYADYIQAKKEEE